MGPCVRRLDGGVWGLVALLVFKTSDPHHAGGGFDSHPLPPFRFGIPGKTSAHETPTRMAFLGLAALSFFTLGRVAADAPRTLTTQFTLHGDRSRAAAGAGALDVWLPIPSDSPWQTVTGRDR